MNISHLKAKPGTPANAIVTVIAAGATALALPQSKPVETEIISSPETVAQQPTSCGAFFDHELIAHIQTPLLDSRTTRYRLPRDNL